MAPIICTSCGRELDLTNAACMQDRWLCRRCAYREALSILDSEGDDAIAGEALDVLRVHSGVEYGAEIRA